jgi:hypothetical protein
VEVTGEIRDLVEAEESSDDEEHQLVPNLTTTTTTNTKMEQLINTLRGERKTAKEGEEAAGEIHSR